MWKSSYRVAVLTSSDKGHAGERADKSGPALCERMRQTGCEIVATALLPDDLPVLSRQLRDWSESGGVDLILTTGGTGFSPRDCMPEATMAIAERNAPGIAEAIRANSMTITPHAMLSRAVSVICRRTLIINLPGSPKAALESLEAVLPALEHGLDILCNGAGECAR